MASKKNELKGADPLREVAKDENGRLLRKFKVSYPGLSTKVVAATGRQTAEVEYAALSGILCYGHDPAIEDLGYCYEDELPKEEVADGKPA